MSLVFVIYDGNEIILKKLFYTIYLWMSIPLFTMQSMCGFSNEKSKCNDHHHTRIIYFTAVFSLCLMFSKKKPPENPRPISISICFVLAFVFSLISY